MTRRSNRAPLGGVLLACLAALTACGDHADHDDSADDPSTFASVDVEQIDDSPEGSYREWLSALADHDAEAACLWHAPEFTIELRRQAILAQRAELGDPCTGFVALLWEDPNRQYDPLGIEVTQDTGEDGELAVDFPGTDETVSMQRRSGRWLVADVTPRSAGGGANSARWVDAWCDLRVDMDREQVIELMGEPSGEYTVANGGEPQLWWADRQYDFRAYLDVDGSVLDLVGDYDRLGMADRQLLDCPELR